jgi:hypothetical protein
MKDYIGLITGLVGLSIALVAFTGAILELVDQPQQLHLFSLIGYFICAVGVIWFAVKATAVPRGWRLASLGALYIVTIVLFIWVGTWITGDSSSPSAAASQAKVIRSEFVGIQTHHGTYITAMDDQPGWDWELKAQENEIKDWERFTLLYLDNGKVALKTDHGRFVTATGDDGCCNWILRAKTTTLRVSDEFKLIDLGNGMVAFETHRGRYVSATGPGQSWRVRAEATNVDDWEKFTLIDLNALP